MKLSKQTSDAVNILLHCKQSADELIKVQVIAEDLNLTKQMALKLANRLSRADLLATVRGPKGGVQLTRLADELPLGQIVRRLEAVLHDAEPNTLARPFDLYFDEAFEAFLDVLDQHTLTDLAMQRAKKTKAKPKKKPAKKRAYRASKTRALAAAQATRKAKSPPRRRAT